MLAGAGVLKGTDESVLVHVHMSAAAATNYDATNKTYIDLQDALLSTDAICATAPIYITETETDGSLTGTLMTGFTVATTAGTTEGGATLKANQWIKKTTGTSADAGKNVFVDFYVTRKSTKVNELQIDAEHFGGYFYVEAQSLWRDVDGADHAVEITLPNVKIQSNFTFSYAATGDPSTFTFTMDAFPGYTWFNQSRKVLMAMQVMDDAENPGQGITSVFGHDVNEVIDDPDGAFFDDSVD